MNDKVKDVIRAFENDELVDAPERVPCKDKASHIIFLLPDVQIRILNEFAERKNLSISTLVSSWLRDRIRQERDEMKG